MKTGVNINRSVSKWRETNLGVSQGSVLRPLLFNIYINEIFFLMKGTKLCNYADNTTMYACDSEIKNVLN